MALFLLLGLPPLMAILIFLVPQRRTRKMILLLTAFVHLMTVVSLLQGHNVQFNPFLGLDAISQLVLLIISILFFVIAMYLISYLREKNRSNKVLIACLLCLLSAMTLVTLSQHMGLLWIAIEATALLSAPLINYHRTPQGIEATWKYLLIASLGIALSLLGTLFLAISATTLKTIFLSDILSNAAFLSTSWLKLSIIFLLVGYGTKMGLAPMHTWKPDAYGEAPGPFGSLLAGGITACAFLAVFRICQIAFHAHLQEFISPILILLGLLSMGIAAIFIMNQKDFNRMLGYSSIENMGILVLGIGLGGGAIWASIFHLINNAFAKGLIFLVSGNLFQVFKTRKVENIQGVIHKLPLTGAFLILGLVVICGFPPFGIFYSELLIFKQAIMAHRYIVVFFYLLFLSVIFFGFSKIIFNMALGRVPEHIETVNKKEDFFMVMPLIILAVILFFTGVFVPDGIYHFIDEASKLLGGG
jgi:hydrogenase-4 component F